MAYCYTEKHVAIGPNKILVCIESQGSGEHFLSLFDGFLVPSPLKHNRPDFTINLRAHSRPPASSDTISPEPIILPIARHCFSLKWRFIIGQIDLSKNTMDLDVYDKHFVFNAALRIGLFFCVLRCGGIMLHAAGVVVPPATPLVFSGRSGSGKTTIAKDAIRRFTQTELLSDEIVLLQRGADKSIYAHSTPFWGELQVKGKKQDSPLERLYFIHKDSFNRTQPLTKQKLVSRLAENTMTFCRTPPSVQFTLGTIAGIAEEIPGFDLHLSRDLSFWDTLDLEG